MAGADYWSCAVCGGKAFYDASIDWDNQRVGHSDGSPRTPEDGSWPGEEALALRVLCTKCAETHKLEVVLRD